MESDYIIPASLFHVVSDLFLDCDCGAHPDITITFCPEYADVIYEVTCPCCGKSSGQCSMHDLDFATLAEDWNSKVSED